MQRSDEADLKLQVSHHSGHRDSRGRHSLGSGRPLRIGLYEDLPMKPASLPAGPSSSADSGIAVQREENQSTGEH